MYGNEPRRRATRPAAVAGGREAPDSARRRPIRSLPGLVAAIGLLLAVSAQAMLLPGATPPQALGSDFAGRERSLAEFRGKVVIVSFWASWCAPCFDEMRLLQRLQNGVGRERLMVVSVNFAQAVGVFESLKPRLAGVALLITSDPRGELGRQYGVKRIPASFVIDRHGLIRYVYSGYGDNIRRRLVEDIDRLLEQAP